MYTNISVSLFFFSLVAKCKDIPVKFDLDHIASAALDDMAEPDDKASSPNLEAPDDGATGDAAADDATAAAEKGDVTAEAGAGDEVAEDWPAASDTTIEVIDDGQASLQPKAKTRPIVPNTSAEPAPKKVKVMEPKEPATPPSAGIEEDPREHAISDYMCDKLSNDFNCDSMSIIALRLLAESSSKGAKEANSIVWNLMRKINTLNSPSAFVSACVVNARRQLGLDEPSEPWDRDSWDRDSWDKDWDSSGWSTSKSWSRHNKW